MYLICFICLASYLKGMLHFSVLLFINKKCLYTIVKHFFSGILPLVLSSDELIPYIRIARGTQTEDLKSVSSSFGSVNNVSGNNKSQIVLLPANSTESYDNLVLKEQYELQNETGFHIIYTIYSLNIS